MEIRLATPNDGAVIAEIYRPFVEGTAISFETTPPDAAEMSHRISTGMATHPWLVAESEADIIGYAYAQPHRIRPAYQWSVDVSVYVTSGQRRSGVATTLYDVLLESLKSLGFRMAFAGIALPNDASIGFHRRLGFELVGTYPSVGYKLGEWRDVTWLSRKLGDTTMPPDPPIRLSVAIPEVEEIIARERW
ncbi:MAG: GNAT family N-acetyltransferase [Acidimicrobiia bacterium]|nr:GNAT family N-acetyltransferase [Acidimicrobiia bacterium]